MVRIAAGLGRLRPPRERGGGTTRFRWPPLDPSRPTHLAETPSVRCTVAYPPHWTDPGRGRSSRAFGVYPLDGSGYWLPRSTFGVRTSRSPPLVSSRRGVRLEVALESCSSHGLTTLPQSSILHRRHRPPGRPALSATRSDAPLLGFPRTWAPPAPPFLEGSSFHSTRAPARCYHRMGATRLAPRRMPILSRGSAFAVSTAVTAHSLRGLPGLVSAGRAHGVP